MATTRDEEGLQVDYNGERAARAPEPYDQNFAPGGSQYAAVAGKDAPPYHAGNQSQQQKVPFGLSILSFGILVALVTAIIVGGAVGGGLGGALASCNNDNNNSESSESPSGVNECDQSNNSNNTTDTNSTDTSNDPNNYAPIPAALVSNVTWYCPENGDNGTIRTKDGYKFHSYCGVNAPETGDGNIVDIVTIWAYYLEDCIGACAELSKKNRTICDSVFFRRNLNVSKTQFGNCWLKGGKLKSGDGAWTDYEYGRAYAELEDD
ncbi:hypothetical protein ACHAPT_008626 [Fusarium lateritium]